MLPDRAAIDEHAVESSDGHGPGGEGDQPEDPRRLGAGSSSRVAEEERVQEGDLVLTIRSVEDGSSYQGNEGEAESVNLYARRGQLTHSLPPSEGE